MLYKKYLQSSFLLTICFNYFCVCYQIDIDIVAYKPKGISVNIPYDSSIENVEFYGKLTSNSSNTAPFEFGPISFQKCDGRFVAVDGNVTLFNGNLSYILVVSGKTINAFAGSREIVLVEYPLEITAYHPEGFRISLRNNTGVEGFIFWANVNRPLLNKKHAALHLSALEATYGVWMADNEDILLNSNDTVYATLQILRNRELEKFNYLPPVQVSEPISYLFPKFSIAPTIQVTPKVQDPDPDIIVFIDSDEIDQKDLSSTTEKRSSTYPSIFSGLGTSTNSFSYTSAIVNTFTESTTVKPTQYKYNSPAVSTIPKVRLPTIPFEVGVSAIAILPKGIHLIVNTTKEVEEFYFWANVNRVINNRNNAHIKLSAFDKESGVWTLTDKSVSLNIGDILYYIVHAKDGSFQKLYSNRTLIIGDGGSDDSGETDGKDLSLDPVDIETPMSLTTSSTTARTASTYPPVFSGLGTFTNSFSYTSAIANPLTESTTVKPTQYKYNSTAISTTSKMQPPTIPFEVGVSVIAIVPKGIRLVVNTTKKIEEFYFWANVNRPITNRNNAHIKLSAFDKESGVWTLTDKAVSVNTGDTLYYILYAKNGPFQKLNTNRTLIIGNGDLDDSDEIDGNDLSLDPIDIETPISLTTSSTTARTVSTYPPVFSGLGIPTNGFSYTSTIANPFTKSTTVRPTQYRYNSTAITTNPKMQPPTIPFDVRVSVLTILPKGIRLIVNTTKEVEEFYFWANVNRPITNRNNAHIKLSAFDKESGVWTLTDKSVSLNTGDILYYIVYAKSESFQRFDTTRRLIIRGGGSNDIESSEEVHSLTRTSSSIPTARLPNHQDVNTIRATDCQNNVVLNTGDVLVNLHRNSDVKNTIDALQLSYLKIDGCKLSYRYADHDNSPNILRIVVT